MLPFSATQGCHRVHENRSRLVRRNQTESSTPKTYGKISWEVTGGFVSASNMACTSSNQFSETDSETLGNLASTNSARGVLAESHAWPRARISCFVPSAGHSTRCCQLKCIRFDCSPTAGVEPGCPPEVHCGLLGGVAMLISRRGIFTSGYSDPAIWHELRSRGWYA